MHTWPTVLVRGPITLRPVRRGDYRRLRQLQAENATWLAAWQIDQAASSSAVNYRRWVRQMHRLGSRGQALALVVEIDGDYGGQVLADPIIYGAHQQATVGYWIAKRYANRGYMTMALALVIDYLVTNLEIHRIEANIQPDNHASIRVVEKLGFQAEGRARALLRIGGRWRDHVRYALLAEDIAGDGLAAMCTIGT